MPTRPQRLRIVDGGDGSDRGRRPRPLRRSHDYRWSPDSRWLAYVKQAGSHAAVGHLGLFRGRGEDRAADVGERGRLGAGLRPDRPIPLLPVQPRLPPHVQRVRVQLRLHRSHARLRRRAVEDGPGAVPAAERRGAAARRRGAAAADAAGPAAAEPAEAAARPKGAGSSETGEPQKPDETRPAAVERRDRAADDGLARAGNRRRAPAGRRDRAHRRGRVRAARARHSRPAGRHPQSLAATERAVLYMVGHRPARAPRAVRHRRQEGEHGPDRRRRLRALARRQEGAVPHGQRLRHRRRQSRSEDERGSARARRARRCASIRAPSGSRSSSTRGASCATGSTTRACTASTGRRSATGTRSCCRSSRTAPISTTSSARSPASSTPATCTCSRRPATRRSRVDGGLLGAEIRPDPSSGVFRIAKIYAGENWHEDFRSPLTEPGVRVARGRLHPRRGRRAHEGRGQLLPAAREQGHRLP